MHYDHPPYATVNLGLHVQALSVRLPDLRIQQQHIPTTEPNLPDCVCACIASTDHCTG